MEQREIVRQLEETRDLRERCIRPIYLSLLHANFIGPRHASSSIQSQIIEIAQDITDDEIARLLEIREWRGRLVAGWCMALSRRSAFVEDIARLLLKSEVVYSGQGYCAALGLIGDDRCRAYLQDYLREYLPLNGRFYDQEWAIGALAFIDGTTPEEFIDPGLWTEGDKRLDPKRGISGFQRVVDFLTLHKMIAGEVGT